MTLNRYRDLYRKRKNNFFEKWQPDACAESFEHDADARLMLDQLLQVLTQYVGQNQSGTSFWGSEIDRYWYERDHKFYNRKGDVYQIYTGPTMQQTEVYTQ